MREWERFERAELYEPPARRPWLSNGALAAVLWIVFTVVVGGTLWLSWDGHHQPDHGGHVPDRRTCEVAGRPAPCVD